MSDILDRLRAHREGAPTIPISIPEWGLEAYIRPISAARHAGIVRTYAKSAERLSAQMIVAALVDDKGAPVFQDDADTMAELVQQPSPLLLRVAQAIAGEMGGDDAKNS